MTVTLIVILYARNNPMRLGQVVEKFEIRGYGEIIQTLSTYKIGQNTEKSPGDLRSLAVTQTSIKTIR